MKETAMVLNFLYL